MHSFRPVAAILFCLGLSGYLQAAEDAPVEITAQGESERSFEAAEQDALRNAVRQAVGVALESQSKVVDFTLIRDAMVTRANGYVRSFTVTDKRRSADDTYLVKVRAECVRGKMDNDFLAIQNLIETMGRPQFSVKVEIKPGSEPGIDGWVEAAFMDELDKTGLSVLDSKTASEAIEREYQRALAVGNTKKAALLKLKMGAPYGVTVSATGSKKEEQVYGAKMTMGLVELKATVSHRDSAEILASKNGAGRAGSADSSGLQDACKKAVATVFPEVMDRILYHWTRDLDVGASITLEVSDLAGAELSALVARLRKAENVTQAEIVEAPEGGIAVVRVIGRIKAESLAEQIPALSGKALEASIDGPRKVSARPAVRPPPVSAAPAVQPQQPAPAAAPQQAAVPPASGGKSYLVPALIAGTLVGAAILGAAALLRKK